jgi:hypothetical protein
MLTRLRLGFAIAAVLVSAHAYAQPSSAPPPTPTTTPAPESMWPRAIADRPYNLNQGMVELHGAMPISGVGGDTEVLAGVGASFGASDKIELGGDYAFQISPKTDAAGIFAAHVKIRLAHDEKMSAALGASILYSHSLYSDGLVLGFGGVAFRYRINKQISIFSDTNVCGGCVNVAGPVAGQFIFANVSDSGGGSSQNIVAFTIPAGIGIQANSQLYLSAATVFGAILLSPTTDSYFLFKDTIPVVASAWMSVSPQVDLGISLTDDVKDASNDYFVELGAKFAK